MKLFTPVAVVCDHTLVEDALAIRSVLESFRLRVDFHRLVQSQQLYEFFAAPPQHYAATVLVCHGSGDDSDPFLRFEVVDQKDGNYQSPDGWEMVTLEWTAARIREHVQGGLGIVLSLACGGGREPLAQAFLDAGCDAYVGVVTPYVDMASAVSFAVNFFYLLMAEDRDYCSARYSVEQAVERAARFDDDWKYGTGSFRCYSREAR